MKYITILALLTNTGFASYEGSKVSDVWDVTSLIRYNALPQIKVNMKRLKKWGQNKLEQSANRTLDNRSDVLPYFEKLVHANGVCLRGTWSITEKTPYSGYFKNGAKGIIISRASSALSKTQKGDNRSLGLAGKIYPTLDINHNQNLKTANFFTIDDLAGTKISQFSKTSLTNEPEVTPSIGSIFLIKMAMFVGKIFNRVDENPNIRQLWQISSLGVNDIEKVKTPMWMRLRAKRDSKKLIAKDFRNEFKENIEQNGEMNYDIEVAGELSKEWGQKQEFKKVGTINFTEYVTSEGCDHRLHFNHPKYRKDIK